MHDKTHTDVDSCTLSHLPHPCHVMCAAGYEIMQDMQSQMRSMLQPTVSLGVYIEESP